MSVSFPRGFPNASTPPAGLANERVRAPLDAVGPKDAGRSAGLEG